MSGGRDMLIPTSTFAIAEIGNKSTNARSIVPRINFFIFISSPLFSGTPRKKLLDSHHATHCISKWSANNLRKITTLISTYNISLLNKEERAAEKYEGIRLASIFGGTSTY
jgi:hypothetical protein